MNERFTALLLACTLLHCGCATGHSARRFTSAMGSFAAADSYEGVKQHFDRLFAQLHEVEQLERRKQPGTAQSSRSLRGLRPFYVAYRRSALSEGTGPHDSNYYRLQHQVLDAFSAQLLQIQRLLTQHPNPRNA